MRVRSWLIRGLILAGVAALVALVANGCVNALFVVGLIVLVNQLEGNFLQPVLMGRSMKLHSFVILIALTVGTVLGGIVGAVLAVPITAVAWGIVQVWDGLRGHRVMGEICDPMHFDKENKRLHA